MKLHLPTGLRKALLACLAALAAHRRVPRTVSTGTALLGVFTMLWSTASRTAAQQAQQSLPGEEEVRLVDDQDEPSLTRAEMTGAPQSATLPQEPSAANALAPLPTAPLASDANATPQLAAAPSVIASSDNPYAIAPITYGSMLMSTGRSASLLSGEEDLRWQGTGALTLGDQSGTPEDGWSVSSENLIGHDVYLEGTPSGDSTITVTVNGGEDGISMKSLTVGKMESDSASYTFSANESELQTITITDALTLNVGEISLGSGVTMTAGSLVVSGTTTLNLEQDSLLTIQNGTVSSGLTLDGAGTLVVEGESTNICAEVNSSTVPNVEVRGGTLKLIRGSAVTIQKVVLGGGILTFAQPEGNRNAWSDKIKALDLVDNTSTTVNGSFDDSYGKYFAVDGAVTGSGTMIFVPHGGSGLEFTSSTDLREFTGTLDIDATHSSPNYWSSYLKIDAGASVGEGNSREDGTSGGVRVTKVENVNLGEGSYLWVKEKFCVKAYENKGILTFATGSTLELSGISDAEAVTLAGSGGTIILDNSGLTVKAKATDAGAMGGIEFKDENSSFTLEAGDLTVGNLKGAGTVTLSGAGAKLTLAYGGDDEDGGTYAGTISAAELAYAGTDKTKKFTLTKGFTGAKLTLSGGILVLQGSVGAEGANTWDISGETQLDLSAEGLSLSGGSIALTVDVREENTLGALKLSEGMFTTLKGSTGGVDKKLTLNLTGATSGHKYRLIDTTGLGDSVTQETLQEFLNSILTGHDDGWRGSVTIDGNGYLTVTLGHALTWDATDQNGTWKTFSDGETDKPWNDSNLSGVDSGFYEGDSVTFNDSGATAHSITIDGTVQPQDMKVQTGTWTFQGSGSVVSEGSLTVSGDGAKMTWSSSGSMTFSGLHLTDTAKLYVSGNGAKNFGGSATNPGIRLEADTELVIQNAAGWVTGGANYATGDGSIVLENLTIDNGSTDSGLLWAFMGAGEGSADAAQIGALVLRGGEDGTGTVLTMSGEMGSNTTGHALGNFKDIYVKEGSTLIVSSAALGAKLHTGNVLHVAGTGATGQDAALVLNDGSLDWDITADADATIKITVAMNYSNHTFDLAGKTLTLNLTRAVGLSGNGSVTGTGTLKLIGNGGSFSGSVASNLEYAGSREDKFTYNGQFTGAYLTVTSGELKLSSGATFGESTTATVKQGGKLNLDGGSYVAAGGSDGGMTVALAGGELHLNQNSEIGVLYGSGKVTAERNGMSLTLSGEAGVDQVFAGSVCPGGVMTVTNLTGRMYLGDGANLSYSTVKVTGTLAMQDSSDDAISATVGTLQVGGASGSVQLGNNTTLTVTESLADIAGQEGHGSITGNGTLRLTTTGTDKDYSGNVSANLVYEGAGTQTLSGEVTGSTVTVNTANGTLSVGTLGNGSTAVTLTAGTLEVTDGGDFTLAPGLTGTRKLTERCDEFGGERGGR